MLNTATMYSAKEYSIGFVLLLTTALSGWLALNSSSETATTTSNQTVYPDSIMRNAVITRMDSVTGLPQDELQTPLLVHYAAGDITNLTSPRFTIQQVGEKPWQLAADQGQANKGIEMVRLWGNVALTQAQGPENPPIQITTTTVTVYPKKQYAETTQAILAKQPDKMLRAVGMQTYFKTGTVELLSHVQGKYQGLTNTQ